MHYFPIIPTCARSFVTSKDESFENDLKCQLSEIIKTNKLMKKFFSSGMKPNAKDLQRLVFRINTYYNNGKKEQVFCPRTCIWGYKRHTKKKRWTHQKTLMRKKGKSGGKNYVRRQRLFGDRLNCNSNNNNNNNNNSNYYYYYYYFIHTERGFTKSYVI